MPQAQRTMVISLQKAGTHLMQGLLCNLGYKMAGVPRPIPANVPQFTDRQRRQIAALTLSKADYDELMEVSDQEAFAERIQDLWSALGWHWQRRLGQRVVNRYGQARIQFADSVITNPNLPYSRFSDTPAGLCWIFHELDMNKVDGSFLSEWVELGSPPLIYNYRDPRDTIVSMVNFLEGRTSAGYGNFYEFDVFSRILADLPTWEDKLEYAMRDRSFLGRSQFETCMWLLHHPDVCTVSYEELVGPEGGGSRERQVAAVDRVLQHIGSDAEAPAVADKIYDPQSWSYHKGTVGAWRDVFTERNRRRFDHEYGDVLAQYGYE